MISVGKCCLLIFPAEVGASIILGDKGTSICSYSLNTFLRLSEAAACLGGLICVIPGCGLQEWSCGLKSVSFVCQSVEGRALSCGGLCIPVCPEEVTNHQAMGPSRCTNGSDGDCFLRSGLLFVLATRNNMAAVGRSKLVTVGLLPPFSSNLLSPHTGVAFELFLQGQVGSCFEDLICGSSQVLVFNLCLL